MAQSERQRIAVNLWTARLIPIVLAAAVAYATYVLVALLCGMLLIRVIRDCLLIYLQSTTLFSNTRKRTQRLRF